MAISLRKRTANRLNGRKSHGPGDTTNTRFNATKHGLLCVGVTELDDVEGYKTQLREMMDEKKPVGIVETFLVESATSIWSGGVEPVASKQNSLPVS